MLIDKWRVAVDAELEAQGGKCVDGKPASARTIETTRVTLYAAFRRWHELGYRIEHPKNVTGKHVDLLVQHWWHTQRKSFKSVENDLSRLRVFFTMMGRQYLVKGFAHYLPEVGEADRKATTRVERSRTWKLSTADMRQLLAKADDLDARLGKLIRMQIAFELTQEEVLRCMPHEHDCKNYLSIRLEDGTWGKAHWINEQQRQVLDFVKQRTFKKETLGWMRNEDGTKRTLSQNKSRYCIWLRKLGLTQKTLGGTSASLHVRFSDAVALACGIGPV